jgi:acetyl-CoA C-acetyltransferase
MKAIIFGASSIILGNNDIVVVGGMENMSQTPYYAPKQRFGSKYGHQELLDGIVKDGLTDAYKQILMGDAAELIAEEMNISREDQVHTRF